MTSARLKLFAQCCCMVTTIVACSSLNKQPTADANQQLADFMASSYQQDLARSPMLQTYRGIKDDYHRWDTLTETFFDETATITESRLAQLDAIDPAALSPSSQLTADIYRQVLQQQRTLNHYRHHRYIMQQFRGWHTRVPSFLINMHQIASVADAQAYISRLNGVKPLMHSVVDQLTIREQKQLLPPRWAYPKMIRSAGNVLIGRPFDNTPEDSTLLADFDRKINALNISETEKSQLLKEAEAALINAVLPGYRHLIDKLTTQMPLASDEEGVWKLADGDAYYQQLLQFYTTTELTADQIHQLGLKQVAAIHKQIEAIRVQVGFKGSIKDFFQHLRSSPEFYYPDTRAGREQYVQMASKALARIESQLPDMFGLLPEAELLIKPVEAFRQQTAGKAFYQAPAENGSRPGIYYVNLYRMNNMPSYQLEALAYHEGLPGHHLQRAIALQLHDTPALQKYARFTAYSEGWALYAESLAGEMNAYSNAYSVLGQLVMELWRACRLVVDTGIHAKRWNKQQAIDYLLANTPNSNNDATKAIERYIVYPGQATAYLIGKLHIMQLRQQAQNTLADRFDLKAFHDEILKNGAMPLSLLTITIQRWINQQLASANVEH